MPDARMTPTQRVLHGLLAGGTVHPVLARLEGLGWVGSDREEVDASAGRPPRRQFRPMAVRSALGLS